MVDGQTTRRRRLLLSYVWPVSGRVLAAVVLVPRRHFPPGALPRCGNHLIGRKKLNPGPTGCTSRTVLFLVAICTSKASCKA